jgi:hypothetical protein
MATMMATATVAVIETVKVLPMATAMMISMLMATAMAMAMATATSPWDVLSLTHVMGEKFLQILQMLPHCTLHALCGSIEKNTYSLVKGMLSLI